MPGFAQEQQVRLRSLAYADGTVRPVFEANVVDVKGGAATAYTVLVDAVSGKVVVRQNKVDQSNDAFQFQGAITATECGPKHQFELTDDNTKQIVATAAAAVTTNDIVVKIFGPGGHAARRERHRHQPRGRHLQRRVDPGRHLLDAGLPLRRPDRPVRRAR